MIKNVGRENFVSRRVMTNAVKKDLSLEININIIVDKRIEIDLKVLLKILDPIAVIHQGLMSPQALKISLNTKNI